MGSVSSLISGHSLHSKHCRASEHKLKKASHNKKAGRGLDGLLRYGFSQDPSATNNNTKAFQSGKNEDFFYIKVSHKPRGSHRRNGAPSEREEMEAGRRTPPGLVPLSGKLEKSAEKALIRPTAFKPVMPRSVSSSMETHHPLSQILGRSLSPGGAEARDDPKREASCSGTLSDSGRNSMSSLPTHSTGGSGSQADGQSCSVGVTTGSLVHYGGSAHNVSLSAVVAGVSGSGGSNGVNGSAGWSSGGASGGAANPGTRAAIAIPLSDSVAVVTSLNRDIAVITATSAEPSLFSAEHRDPFLEPASLSGGGCERSPVSADDSLIQRLERRLAEREWELTELQGSLDEKEADTCLLFQERQRYCAEEMEGLKQRCSSKLRQVSQRALRGQQLLQLQVIQLQQDKECLQEEVERLGREREAAEGRLRSYETEQTQLAPTLEETQWEVCQKSGEISLLKQQLKDSKADVGHKLNEIVCLKASLRENRGKMEGLEQRNREHEEALHSRNTEVEVCQNELQRKKNEANLLREKVGKLETDIKSMKQDLALAKQEQLQLLTARAKMEEEQLQLQISRAKMEVLGAGRAKMADQEGPGGSRGEGSADLQREVERLRGELSEERQRKDSMASGFQQEKQTWNREKDKVIKYQRQLQHNYLQMHRKNQGLEQILRELTAEMDGKTELDGPELHYDDVVATEI